MSKRDSYVMVAEDDPGWLRFWDAYPRRCSKKEARKAWSKLKPSPELVDRIVAALAWQVPLRQWDGPKQDYAPYPASWLNGERWTDAPPNAQRERNHQRWNDEQPDARGHVPPCRTWRECNEKVLAEARANR